MTFLNHRRFAVLPALLFLFAGCHGGAPADADPDDEPDPPVVIDPAAHARFVKAVEKRGGQVEVLDEKRGLSGGVKADFPRVPVTDRDLRALRGGKVLRELELWQTAVTGTGFKYLAGLPRLRKLGLTDSEALTDAGFRELARLTQVRSLDLTFTAITDARLRSLGGMRKLRELRLDHALAPADPGRKPRGNPVTDKGLKELARLTDLRVLSLHGLPLTDAGLRHLAGLRRLRELNLDRTRVTEAALAEVARFPQLRKLGFVTEKVSAAGVKQLARLTRLRQLRIRVTPDGLEELGQLSGLEELHVVDDGALTADAVRKLAALKGLRKLEIQGAVYQLVEAGLGDLRKALPRCEISFR